MTLAFCPDGRPLRTQGGYGKLFPAALHASLLKARIDVCDSALYSASGTQSVLDRLLDGGHITLTEYLERLPEGLLPNKEVLMEAHRKETTRNDIGNDPEA
jgi:hypothetical protein